MVIGEIEEKRAGREAEVFLTALRHRGNQVTISKSSYHNKTQPWDPSLLLYQRDSPCLKYLGQERDDHATIDDSSPDWQWDS